MTKINIAIFASGSGTNAENIIKFFQNHEAAKVNLVLCNNSNAGVIEKVKKYNVPVYLFNKEYLKSGEVLKKLKENNTGFIVLAGFLWLMPSEIVTEYPDKIVNIHPALLPKYGGKGMYGMNVHQAVVENKENESGITIHFVNEAYDQGNIIFQAKCPVYKNDKPEDVASRIHELEYEHFPQIIEMLVLQG